MIDFFILGNPRSGTTLLRLMLTAHTKIVVPPEAGFGVWLITQADSLQKYDHRLFIEALAASKKIENWMLDYQALYDYLDANRVNDLATAILSVYDFYALKHHKKGALIGDKNNFYIHHISTLAKLSPAAKYIHIVRDGRDVACSYRELMAKNIVSNYAPILSRDIQQIANEWALNNQDIIDGLVGRDSLCIRLEDLISAPQVTLKRVCGFLGLNFENNMMAYYADANANFFEPVEFDQWKQKNKRPLINDSFKYKHLLDRQELASFEAVAGNLLDYFGYELNA